MGIKKKVITTKTGYMIEAMKKVATDKDVSVSSLLTEANVMRSRDELPPMTPTEGLWSIQSLTRQKIARKAARQVRKESNYGTGRKVNVYRLAKGWEKRVGQ